MDPLQSISAYSAPFPITPNTAVSLTTGLLAAELSPLSQGLFGGSSAIVETSSVGQLLSLTSQFQDKLTGVQSDIAANGVNSTNLVSSANTLIDAFNTLQTGIADINGLGNLFGGTTLDGVYLAQALDNQALADIPNGNSQLTNLSQIGISLQPTPNYAAGVLNLNQDTLQSAFNADPAGVGTLLSQAINNFGNLANDFVTQLGGQYAALSSLMQITAFDSVFNPNQADSLLNSYFDLAGLLALQNTTQNNVNGTATRNVLLALSNYITVSQLFS